MIIDSYRKSFLGLILSNNIVIQNLMDLFRLQQIDVCIIDILLLIISQFLFHNL